MNDLYQQMLAAYEGRTPQARRNAAFEVAQQIILAGLADGGFFDKAAFYGGTCLRIFHGLNRFSEDMDFSLLAPDAHFDFTRYFPSIINQFALIGRQVEIKRKDKKTFSRVESAFLKDNTDVFDVAFQTEKAVRIKIEVDTLPPLRFATELQLALQPKSFYCRCFTLPCLFAGKMHALVYRTWHNRVKGRDWYDFEWYVRHGVPLDFNHLQERIREFGGGEVSAPAFRQLLNERLTTANMAQVKADVMPFLSNPHETDIWTNSYFVQLAEKMKMEE